MTLPADVEKYIARKFAASDQEMALYLLRNAVLHDGTTPGPRLLRCAAVASGGSLDRLKMESETLRHDYRDVIVEGEYIPAGKQLIKARDLNLPIPDEA